MRGTQITWSAIVLLAAFGCANSAREGEESGSLEKAPAAVQAAAKKYIGQNKIGEISKEVSNGKTIYDIEFTIKGVTYAAEFDESGNLVARSVDIDGSVVPPAVVEAVKKAHPGGTIGEIEMVTEGDKMFYAMEVKAGSEIRAMEISAGGTVIADTIAPAETEL